VLARLKSKQNASFYGVGIQAVSVFWMLSVGVGGMSGCGKQGSPEIQARSLVPPKRMSPEESWIQYEKSEKSSHFGRLETRHLNEEPLKKKISILSNLELKPLEISAELNAKAYYVAGSPVANQVILRPRIWLISSVTGERLQVLDNHDDTVSIYVSLALIDGLEPTISTGQGLKQVPKELLVTDQEQLQTQLQAQLHAAPIYASSIPCPESMSFQSTRDGSFPIQFKTKLKSCPLNWVFPAQIVLRMREWRSLEEAFLREDWLSLEAQFNLSIPVALDIHEFHLSSDEVESRLQQLVSAKIKDESSLSSDGLKDVLGTLIQEIEQSFDLDLPVEYFSSFKDQLIHRRIEEKAGCTTGPNRPNRNEKCFSLGNQARMKEEYSFQVKRDEYFGRALSFVSVSRISDLAAKKYPLLLQSKSSSLLSPPEQGEVNSLFHTVQEGDLVEISIQKLRVSEIAPEQVKETTTQNPTCNLPFKNCLDGKWRCDWHQTFPGIMGGIARTIDKCKPLAASDPLAKILGPWVAPVAPAQPTLPYRMRYAGSPYDPARPFDPNNHFEWECTRMSESLCAPQDWENHWTRVTTWSIPSLSTEWKEHEFYKGDLDEVLAKISIQFDSSEEKEVKKTTCKLSDLELRMIPPNRVIISMQNTSSCSPFNDLNRKSGYGPIVSLISKVSIPSEFQCGQLIEQWDGNRQYICRLPDGTEIQKQSTFTADVQALSRGEKIGIWKPYYPRAEVQGFLKIIGSYFESGKDVEL